MSDSILERYKQQLAKDRETENDDFTEDFDITVDEDYRKEYKKELNKQRSEILDNEKQYTDRLNKTLIRLHEDKESSSYVKEEDVDHIIVKHFYCPECGEELISNGPPMFNPFTYERICLHECKCGKRYNLDYAYPRYALINKEGKEIKAYGI